MIQASAPFSSGSPDASAGKLNEISSGRDALGDISRRANALDGLIDLLLRSSGVDEAGRDMLESIQFQVLSIRDRAQEPLCAGMVH